MNYEPNYLKCTQKSNIKILNAKKTILMNMKKCLMYCPKSGFQLASTWLISENLQDSITRWY